MAATTASARLRRLAAPGAALALLLSACGQAASTSDTTAADSTPAGGSAVADSETTAAGSSTTATHPVLTAVATAPDGSTFSVADFAGRTVFVETFATWCSNCRRQLGDTNLAAAQAGDDAVFLALSIETDLDPARLADYAAEHGFDNVLFGVLDAQGLAVLNEQFGRSVLSAPSTPKFIVSPDGQLGELVTGFESPDEILAQLA